MRPPIEHDLKCWPESYELTRTGFKPWEFRLNDRDYQEGDTLHLRAWDPKTQSYLGTSLRRRVMLVFRGGFGIPEGYVIMTLGEPLDGEI